VAGAAGSGLDWAMLERRGRLMEAIRAYFSAAGVLEVDTPMLRRTCASDPHIPETPVQRMGEQPAYLQSSPEALLKCLVAEHGRPIYQLGHVYRAGEVGHWHQPEFLMLEWYRPGWGMQALMDEVLAVLRLAAPALESATALCDWGRCFEQQTGVPADSTPAVLRERAGQLGFSAELTGALDAGGLRDLLFSHCVQPMLGRDGPQFVTGFLADDASFARLDPEHPERALRFEVYWKGVELANGGEELTDASVWRQRASRDHAERRARGAAPIPLDTDWQRALEQGLPACSGVALGVDRLLMLAAGADSIQAVVPFASSEAT